MALNPAIITMISKKEYKDVEAELNKEVEVKMKAHLSGFTNYLEKTTFNKEN